MQVHAAAKSTGATSTGAQHAVDSPSTAEQCDMGPKAMRLQNSHTKSEQQSWVMLQPRSLEISPEHIWTRNMQ